MTQSELINNLWERSRTENISVYDSQVYSFFLHCVFALKASNPFTFSSESIAGFLGISRTTFFQSCKKLENLGLIGKYKYKNLKKIPLFTRRTTVVHQAYDGNSLKNNNRTFYYVVGLETVKTLNELTFLSIKSHHSILVVHFLYNPNEISENTKNEPILYSKGLTDTNNDLGEFSYRFSNPRTRARKIGISNYTHFVSNRSIYTEEKSLPIFDIIEDNNIKYLVTLQNFQDSAQPSKNEEKNTEEKTENWSLQESLENRIEGTGTEGEAIRATLKKSDGKESSPQFRGTPLLESEMLWKEYDDVATPAEKGSALGFARWFMTLLPKNMQDKITVSVFKGWMIAYDQLLRIDRRDPRQIVEICIWARKDEFWATNFYSPAKLRKRSKNDKVLYYDLILLQMKKEKSNGTPTREDVDRRKADRDKRWGIDED